MACVTLSRPGCLRDACESADYEIPKIAKATYGGWASN
jgi:hypothetical protein